MKQQITYLIPNTPQGETNKAKTATIIAAEVDRDWMRFTCEDGSTLHIPTHWVIEQKDI